MTTNSPAAVEIVPYDPAWAAIYEREQQAIARALGAYVVRLEHIGSTSVSGLSAKPVVDLQAEVIDLRSRGFYDEALDKLGYRSIDSSENDVRIAMRKREDVAANLHLVTVGSWAAQRTVLFRDALRADKRLVMRYALLKQTLAADTNNLDEYTSAKTVFIEAVVAERARALGVAYVLGNRR